MEHNFCWRQDLLWDLIIEKRICKNPPFFTSLIKIKELYNFLPGYLIFWKIYIKIQGMRKISGDKRLRISKNTVFGIFFLLTLFFVSYQFFHTEKGLEVDKNCPICRFENTTVFFIDLTALYVALVILLAIVYKIYLDSISHKQLFLLQSISQRAPPF